jgi:hypothetical protein
VWACVKGFRTSSGNGIRTIINQEILQKIMKKIFSLAIICCMVVLSGIAFSSCKPEEKGDYFFSIKLDPASVDSHLDSYNVLVYPKMFDAMAKDAKESFPENGTLIFSGEKNEVMKKAKESFQKAAKSIEDAPNYNQGGVIYTGMKVLLMYTNTDGEGQVDEAVDYHTFK